MPSLCLLGASISSRQKFFFFLVKYCREFRSIELEILFSFEEDLTASKTLANLFLTHTVKRIEYTFS